MKEGLGNDHVSALITEAQRQGITITPEDVPEILQSGMDKFIARRNGQDILEKRMLGIYLILNELRATRTNVAP